MRQHGEILRAFGDVLAQERETFVQRGKAIAEGREVGAPAMENDAGATTRQGSQSNQHGRGAGTSTREGKAPAQPMPAPLEDRRGPGEALDPPRPAPTAESGSKAPVQGDGAPALPGSAPSPEIKSGALVPAERRAPVQESQVPAQQKRKPEGPARETRAPVIKQEVPAPGATVLGQQTQITPPPSVAVHTHTQTPNTASPVPTLFLAGLESLDPFDLGGPDHKF